MKNLLFLLLLLLSFQLNAQDVYVHGYYRKNGTYVKPHYRSHPDGNPYNNWSFPGNTNPYTGKTATGTPSTYLKNYYNHSSSTNNSNSYNSTYTPSYDYSPHTYSSPNYNYDNSYLSNYYVTASSLNVRSGPSTKYSKIGSLSYAEEVQVLRKYNNGWEKIKYTYIDIYSYETATRIGYVSGKYLSDFNSFMNQGNSNTTDWDNYNFSNTTSTYGSGMGKITFWTNCGTEGNIDIYIDGHYVGELTRFFENGSPSCGSSGTLSITKPEGTYFIKAKSSDHVWSGTVTVREGRCTIEGIKQ